MTAEEFEKRYIANSKITTERYKRRFVTLPCNCGDEGCPGWAAVQNEEFAIKVHKALYAPIE